MAKPLLRKQARELRQAGNSIKYIAEKLGVAQSTTSMWCRDVHLTEEQLATLQTHARDPYYGKRLQNVFKQQNDRKVKTERLIQEGVAAVGVLNHRELFLVGSALYWAEGYKKDNQAGLGSSDPLMMRLYIRWLHDCFGYTNRDLLFRLTANSEHEYRIQEITAFWAKLLGISIEDFQKPFYQHAKWKKQYDNPHTYYGVLRVRVRKSSDLLRRIHGYIEGLKINAQ